MPQKNRLAYLILLFAATACSNTNDASSGASGGNGGGTTQSQASSTGAGGGQGGHGVGGAGQGGAGQGGAGQGGDGASGGGGTTMNTACPKALPSNWIFCEDFESSTPASERFFEFNDDDGDFRVVSAQAHSGGHALEAVFQSGEVGAGYANIAFGNNPIHYGQTGLYRAGETIDEIYWRMQVRHQSGWPDVGPAKLSRVTSIAKSDWGQAMIAHLWSAGDDVILLGDPASCVAGSNVQCSGYNDFTNLSWLGVMPGQTAIFSNAQSGQWMCVEGHVKLNTPGASDGVFEFWINDQLEASRTDLDWRGSYTAHGLNLMAIENYWNAGSPTELRRWFDDIAVAEVRIGCGG